MSATKDAIGLTTHEAVTEILTNVQKVMQSGGEYMLELESDESLSEADFAYLAGHFAVVKAGIDRAVEAAENIAPGGEIAELVNGKRLTTADVDRLVNG